MLDNGFIKLHRALINWEWYADTNTKALFIHLLLTVNYGKKQWRGVEIERGQRVCSYDKLATECGLSIRQVRTALTHLITTGEVTQSKCFKSSIITVNNYDGFQSATQSATGNALETRHNVRQDSDTINSGKATFKVSHKRQLLKNSKEIKNISTLKDTSIEKNSSQDVADMFNEICVSFSKCTVLSDKRKKAISARMNTGLSIDDFKRLFEMAEASSFLKGKNSKNWKANFDWLIADGNMAKVLDGNYVDRTTSKGSFDTDDFFNAAVDKAQQKNNGWGDNIFAAKAEEERNAER